MKKLKHFIVQTVGSGTDTSKTLYNKLRKRILQFMKRAGPVSAPEDNRGDNHQHGIRTAWCWSRGSAGNLVKSKTKPKVVHSQTGRLYQHGPDGRRRKIFTGGIISRVHQSNHLPGKGEKGLRRDAGKIPASVL